DGFFVEGNVGLAMRRLSIIDIRTGQQPISNEDESLWIVYNGEIYNHRDLRSKLEARGHRYRTKSDTETIVHLYEEYGRDCVQHLHGMFAFAIWDRRSRRLFIARDRLGIKPLYYFYDGKKFVFGSEIKAILAYPGIKPEFNQSTLAEYLAFGYIAGQETMFTGIRKLLPGNKLEIDDSGKIKVESYWDLSIPAGNDGRPRAHYIKTYRELLEECVASHLMSDVPLGVFLSGGLDSSAVAALTSKIRGEQIETFSVGYGEEAYRELRRVHWGPVSVANWNTRFWCAMGLPGPLSTSIISIPLSPLLKQRSCLQLQATRAPAMPTADQCSTGSTQLAISCTVCFIPI